VAIERPGFYAPRWSNVLRTKVHAKPIAGLGDNACYHGSASLSVLRSEEDIRGAVIGVPNVLKSEEKLPADALLTCDPGP
jgi:hypothetical protein